VVEDQQRGQDKAAEKSLPCGAAEEADELLVEVVGEAVAEPVAQGGARDALLVGVLPLRGGLCERIGEVGEGLRGVQPAPLPGLLPRVDTGRSLRRSHGSFLFAISWRSHRRGTSHARSALISPIRFCLYTHHHFSPLLRSNWPS